MMFLSMLGDDDVTGAESTTRPSWSAVAIPKFLPPLRGRERPHELFGRLKAEKVGSLPPNLVIFSVSLFSSSCLLFPRFPETYAEHKEKKMVKTKLKYVIPTFFTCFAQILTARTEGSFLLSWSDPRFNLGTEPCTKVGFYKRGCQEKTLLPPQERNQISDIPLRPSDCNTICCVPRNFSLHVAGRSRRHSGTCKQRGGY